MKTLIQLVFIFSATIASAQNDFETDVFPTTMGDFTITAVGHGTIMFQVDSLVIHVDPVSKEADYSQMPKADLILITHHHGDHLDGSAIQKILTDSTKIVLTEKCSEMLEYADQMDLEIMENGDNFNFHGIKIEAIPAYNIVNKRENGQPYHIKGEGNGYILRIGDFSVLVAGDTENIPEIKALKGIDVAFLPMNLPYTMTPEMVIDAIKAFKPEVLFPYHFSDQEFIQKLKEMIMDVPDVELRVRAY